MSTTKIMRVTTIPISLGGLLKGQLGYMRSHFEISAISSRTDQYLSLDEYGRDEGVRVIPIEMTRKITPFRDLKAVYQLYRIFRKEKPEIVHSHTPKAGTTAMLAAKLAGVPHRMHTIAGLPLLEAKGSKRKLLNLVERITYHCATGIYPNSFGLKDIISKEGFTTENKLKVIGNGSSNGVDIDHFNPWLFDQSSKMELRKKLGISPTDFVFIYSGRYVRDKGINELVEAFITINRKHPETKLLLMGCFEDDLDPLLPATVEAIKHHKAIIDTGWHKEIRPYFSVADTLVFPSYREGFPNTVLQAGAMGLYSIVSDINGCNEIIIDGENGKIIPPKNSEALKNAMLQALSSITPMGEPNEYYRNMTVERYSRPKLWQALLTEYQALVGETPEVVTKPKVEVHV